MTDCIFCKIITGEIPSTKVYEDELFFGFLDINPVTKGHTLLVPKEHSSWMQETSSDVVGKIFICTKELMKKMIDRVPCDFVQVVVEGIQVKHFHIHLIPRMTGDEESVVTWHHTKYKSNDELNMYADKIKN